MLQSLSLLFITLSLVLAAEKNTKKTEKTGVKRQIGYGLEAIPGVAAIHAPFPEEYFAVGHPTAHGGVQPLGIIHNAPALDSIGGFTSQGFDALQSGFGIYASPHALIATPFVNVHGNTPKTVHQLDQGWKGIDPGQGHGSIKFGHQIAKSLTTKPAVPVHESVVFEVAPQYDFGKVKHAYTQNSLAPSHSGFGPSGFSVGNKGFVFPSGKAATHTPHQGLPANKGYSFSTLHAPQTHSVHSAFGGHHQQPTHNYLGHNFHLANHQNYLHNQNALTSHKAHAGHSDGMVHGSVTHGHHLAKTSHLPTGHSGFGSNIAPGKSHLVDTKHFGHGSHGNAVHGHKKIVALSNNYHVPSGHGLTSPGLSHVPSGPSRVNLGSGEFPTTHDSSRRTSSTYNSDFNSPTSSSFGSSEHSDVSSSTDVKHTNGHGGGQKATSFQSFIIHSYKPAVSPKKHEYESNESDENYSGANYNSAQALSGESHF
ncbi:hypothetical protein GE061_013243 [Apolygus lucorum]|uniref:Uncharacterized protein n=1 Tax=Apolygus lucorum TaxID=248454 RepID=A0A8S9XUX1_APOLU|nr:hypothetical protein GE061_013243 [Apolygus lucorum]